MLLMLIMGDQLKSASCCTYFNVKIKRTFIIKTFLIKKKANRAQEEIIEQRKLSEIYFLSQKCKL